MEGFTSYRSSEPYELDHGNNIHIDKSIAQYLTAYQLKGIKILYDNYKKCRSTILNDETGLGKRVQISCLIDAIGAVHSTNVIIFCPDTAKQQAWCYHLATFAPNTNVQMLDSLTLANLDVQQPQTYSVVYITTNEAICERNVTAINEMNCDLLVLDEANEFLSTEQITQLEQLDIPKKIVSASENIVMNISHFFDVLKLCDELKSFQSTRSQKPILTLAEFKASYGSYCNKSLSARDYNLRLSSILNICRSFYIQRFRSRIPNRLPLIDPDVYEKNLQQWQRNKAIEDKFNSYLHTLNMDDKTKSNQETPEFTDGQNLSQEIKKYLSVTSDNDMYFSESEMSPLVYESSDTENELDETIDKPMDSNGFTQSMLEISSDSDSDIPNGQTRFRTDVAMMQHSSDIESEAPCASQRITRSNSTSSITQTQDIPGTALDAIVGSSSKTQALPKNKMDSTPWWDSSSDVEFISETSASPIYVPNSSESILRCGIQTKRTKRTKQNNKTGQVSSNSTKSKGNVASSRSETGSRRPEGVVSLKSLLNSIFAETQEENVAKSGSVDILEKDTNTSGSTTTKDAPQTNHIESTTDIFEITKQKILAEKKQGISDLPLAEHSCFDGFRVLIPKLKCIDAITSPKNIVFPKTPAPKPATPQQTKEKVPLPIEVEIINLVDTQPSTSTSRPSARRSLQNEFDMANKSKPIELSQSNVETTPSRRMHNETPSLSASTLKRKHKIERTSTGWISKRQNPRGSNNEDSITPKSRRRLDIQFPSTSKQKYEAESILTKPRSIFNSRRYTRSQKISNAANDSPILLASSNEY